MALYFAIEPLLVVALLIYAVRGRLSRQKKQAELSSRSYAPVFLVGQTGSIFPQRDGRLAVHRVGKENITVRQCRLFVFP